MKLTVTGSNEKRIKQLRRELKNKMKGDMVLKIETETKEPAPEKKKPGRKAKEKK
jgi:hypothetical protein